MEHKKVIIFDFDGVIIDSWEHAYHGNLRNWPDLKIEEHKNLFNGNIFEEANKLPQGKYSEEENMRWFKEEHNLKKKNLPIFEGIQEVFKILTKNYRLVINTSADSESTISYLKQNGIDFFEAIYDNEVSKNKLDKFKKILADYDVQPADCLFITDTAGDVREANKASIPTLAVTYGYHNKEYFSSLQDKVIGFADTPAEILKFISRGNL